MKTLITLFSIVLLFTSCGYHKDNQIYSPMMSNESYYMVRVFGPQGFGASGALIIYKIPMEGINDFKVDSINKEADRYIERCEKYTK